MRTTVKEENTGISGTHSYMVTEVSLYDNSLADVTTDTKNHLGKTSNKGIVDAKLQQFFEYANGKGEKTPQFMKAYQGNYSK